MVAIWIIGAVLLLAAFLLLAPVSFDVSFRGSFSGQARYLFFKFPLAVSREEEAPPGQEDVPREAEAPSEGLLKSFGPCSGGRDWRAFCSPSKSWPRR